MMRAFDGGHHPARHSGGDVAAAAIVCTASIALHVYRRMPREIANFGSAWTKPERRTPLFHITVGLRHADCE